MVGKLTIFLLFSSLIAQESQLNQLCTPSSSSGKFNESVLHDPERSLIDPIVIATEEHRIPHLLKLPINPNTQDTNGNTVLHLAVKAQNPSLTSILVNNEHIDINAKNNEGLTPLHLAAAQRNHALVTALLAAHLRIDVNAQDKYQRTPLNFAAQQDQTSIVDALLENKSLDVNLADNVGWSALHWAASQNCIETVRILLTRARPDLTAKDTRGLTPLDLAKQNSNKTIINLLTEHIKNNATN